MSSLALDHSRRRASRSLLRSSPTDSTRKRLPASASNSRWNCREVLTLVTKGLPNKVIARQLFISEATVKSHLVHLFGKLGADNRTAAVAAARRAGVIR